MSAGYPIANADEAPCLSPVDEEGAKWIQYAATKDETLRLHLIDFYLPFARMLAAKLYSRRQGLDAPFEDYLHYAVLAMIQAVDRYDPALGPQFKAFAKYRIEGMILNELPRLSEQHAQIGLISRLRKERISSLAGELGENKKPKAKGLLFEEMVEIAVGLSIGYMLEESGMYCEDDYQDERDGYAIHAVKELSGLLKKLIELLPEKQKVVIKCIYFFEFSMEETGLQLNLTKGRVSQLHKQALSNLKTMTDTVGLNLNV